MLTRSGVAVVLAVVSAFTTVGVLASAVQNVPSRSSDEQVARLLSRTKQSADRFRDSLDGALNRSSIDGSREENNIKQFVEDFAEAADHLSDHFGRGQVVTHDVEDVLRRSVSIDGFMQRHALAVRAENDWLVVRRDLDELARVYNVAWDWSSPRYSAIERPVLYQRLSGTYQLEPSRGDDPRELIERAIRAVPSSQRRDVSERLMSRLGAPETLAIERVGTSVVMASSAGPRVAFDADGVARAEQGPGGQSVTTRATLHGDQLVVTRTGSGSGGGDFAATFEPIDDGRGLLVTRRIVDPSLRQAVMARSFYRKSSDGADWGVFRAARRTSTRSGAVGGGLLGVPDGTPLVGTLDSPLSTRDARAEDRFTITVHSPSQYEGAILEGSVSTVNASGRISGRADLTLNFERIRLRNGGTYPFAGVIDEIRTADGDSIRVDSTGGVEGDSQTGRTVQRGAIGAGLGAIIGAVAGGGQGAAIGAAIGATGGAGTVVVQGRDQLDLPRGTEFTIMSGTP